MKKRIASLLMALGLMTNLGETTWAQNMSGAPAATNAPPMTPSPTSSPTAALPPTSGPSTPAEGVITTPPAPTGEMAPIIVTGSMIPTTAGEIGPTPIDYVTDAAITKTDADNLFEALKKISPDFQGGGNFGQELNNNSLSAGEAEISLRNLPTLVLIDGERVVKSPLSQGGYFNLNLMPTSFVDHVEILKDGASTLYGSDAIGGVVNIITKHNFTGVQVQTQYGFAGGKGDFYSDKTSVIGGISNDTTSVVAGIEYTDNSAILSTERPIASLSQNELAKLGGGAAPSYFSSNYPNLTGLGSKGTLIFAGNPLAAGAPGYKPGATTPGVTGVNLAAAPVPEQDAILAAEGYIPISSLVGASGGDYRLNTTMFGTYSFTPQEREQAYANFSQDIYKDTVVMFASFIYNHGQASSNLAPQPAPLTADGVVVPADNPFNPTGAAIDGTNGVSIKYRFLDAGNRTSTQTDDYYHFISGLKGDFGLGTSADKDYHYSLTFGYDSESSELINANYINTAAFQSALDGTLVSPTTGANLGFYNPFGIPQSNPKALTDAFTDNEFENSTADLEDLRADVSGTPYQLPGGPIGFAIGGEYRVESLQTIVDGVTAAGDQLGANATSNFPTASRTTEAAYAEVNVPIVGPNMDIPGIYSLSVDASGRYENIDRGANSEIARVNLRYQPYDEEVTLRADFSQSFLAPTLYELYGPAVQTFAAVNLPAGGGEAAGSYQEAFNEQSGPTPNTTAQNFGFGVVYSPKQIKGLTVSADYYNVIENSPSDGDFQDIVNNINALGAASPYAKNFHGLAPITGPGQAFDANFASLDVFPSGVDTVQKTSGIDFNLTYVCPFTKYGIFTVGAAATYLIDYYAQDAPGGPFTNYAGTYSDPGNLGGGAQGLLPKYQVNPYFEYTYGGIDFNLSAQYIPDISDLGDIDASNGTFNDYSADGKAYSVGSYYTLDSSISYEFGAKLPGDAGAASLTRSSNWWDTAKFTFGCNNFTNEQAPFVPSSSEDNTAKGTYDIIGRFYYFQFSKNF